ncbi:MAG: T9SS type A sorting domain-containing protein [Bacteroidota bacterium]
MPPATSLALRTLLALTLAASLAAQSQTATVETVLPAGSAIDDGLTLGPDGALYGSRFGGFPTPVGRTVTRVSLPDATTSVYADGFNRANGLAFGPDGTLYVANYASGTISAVAPDGTASTFASAPGPTTVSGLLYDTARDLLVVASYDGNWVKTVDANGTFADLVEDDLNFPAGLAFDDDGRLYVADFELGKIHRIDGYPNAGSLVLVADLGTDVGFLAYGGDRLFATGIDDNRVYEVTLDGTVAVLAGTGTRATLDGPGDMAQFSRPNGIVATSAGDTLYVSQAGDRALRRIVRTVDTSAEDTTPESGARLLPPAPNPTTGSTTLRLRLPVPTELDLVVADVLGRQVQRLAHGLHSAGEHTLRVALDGVPAGVYFVTLRTRYAVETQRLTVR